MSHCVRERDIVCERERERERERNREKEREGEREKERERMAILQGLPLDFILA